MAEVKREHREAAQVALLGLEVQHPAILDLFELNVAEQIAEAEQRGREAERAAVVAQLNRWGHKAFAVAIEAGEHLEADNG